MRTTLVVGVTAAVVIAATAVSFYVTRTPSPPASITTSAVAGNLPGQGAMQNLGMVAFRLARTGRYLQAHDDNGEMHASNENRHEEETWFLIEIDKGNRIYAIANWKSGKFITKAVGVGCAPADSVALIKNSEWQIVPGPNYGITNAVALKSVADGTYLGGNNPNDNDRYCHGEVNAASPDPPQGTSAWGGWWVPEAATAPTQGHNVWNTVGGYIVGLVNKISPADIARLFS